MNAGADGCALHFAISLGATRGMSPGIVNIVEAFAANRRAAAVTAPVWPSRPPSVQTCAPQRSAMRVTLGSSVTTAMPPSAGAPGKGLQHVLEHGERQFLPQSTR